VVLLPDQRPLVIDAKFPLESIRRSATARPRNRSFADSACGGVMKHINDIAEKYICPGETQDTALMFVPSESVYAELHDGFDACAEGFGQVICFANAPDAGDRSDPPDPEGLADCARRPT